METIAEKKARRAHRKQMFRSVLQDLQREDVEKGFAIECDDLGNIVRKKHFRSTSGQYNR